MNIDTLITIGVNLVLLTIGYTKFIAVIAKFLTEQKAREEAQKLKDKAQDDRQKEIEKDLTDLNKKYDNSVAEFNKTVAGQAERHSNEMKLLEKQRLLEIEKSNNSSEAILKIVTNIQTQIAVINNTAELKNKEFDNRITKLESNSENIIKPQRGRPRGK